MDTIFNHDQGTRTTEAWRVQDGISNFKVDVIAIQLVIELGQILCLIDLLIIDIPIRPLILGQGGCFE